MYIGHKHIFFIAGRVANLLKMVVTINSTSTPEEIEAALRKLQKNNSKASQKHFDAFKYCGVIKLKEDPLAIQKKMREN